MVRHRVPVTPVSHRAGISGCPSPFWGCPAPFLQCWSPHHRLGSCSTREGHPAPTSCPTGLASPSCSLFPCGWHPGPFRAAFGKPSESREVSPEAHARLEACPIPLLAWPPPAAAIAPSRLHLAAGPGKRLLVLSLPIVGPVLSCPPPPHSAVPPGPSPAHPAWESPCQGKLWTWGCVPSAGSTAASCPEFLCLQGNVGIPQWERQSPKRCGVGHVPSPSQTAPGTREQEQPALALGLARAPLGGQLGPRLPGLGILGICWLLGICQPVTSRGADPRAERDWPGCPARQGRMCPLALPL